ncbi:MAG: tetratricopeptide repeat protein [bacterium]
MQCSQCNTQNIAESSYCLHCGFKFKEEAEPILWTGVRKNICTNCSFPSYMTSIFCIRCGYKLPHKDNVRIGYQSQENIFSMLLVKENIITEYNRIEIMNIMKTKQGFSFMDIMISYQFLKEEGILYFLSQKLNVPFVPITNFSRPDKSLLQLIPEGISRRQNVTVVALEGNIPLIAMSDPLSTPALTELRSILPNEAFVVICSANDIRKTIDNIHPKRPQAPKIHSATQIEAYDIESVNAQPVKKKPAQQHPSSPGEMFIPISKNLKKKQSRGTFIFFVILFICIIIGAGGWGVYYKYKDRLLLPSHLKNGNESFEGKNYTMAIKEYQYYLKYRPEDIDVHFKLGKALFEKNDYQSALDHLYIVAKERKNSAELHYLIGLSNFHYRIYTEAIDQFKKVLKIDPAFKEAVKYLGIANIYLGDHKAAIMYLEKTLSSDPNNMHIAEWLVEAYLKDRKYTKATEISKNILRKNPNSPKVLSIIGYAQGALGNFDNAVEYYTQSGLFVSDSVESHLKKAYTHYQENQLDDAISEYVKVLTLRKNDSEAYNNLGIIYKKKGYSNASQEASKKAKRILRIR